MSQNIKMRNLSKIVNKIRLKLIYEKNIVNLNFQSDPGIVLFDKSWSELFEKFEYFTNVWINCLNRVCSSSTDLLSLALLSRTKQ